MTFIMELTYTVSEVNDDGENFDPYNYFVMHGCKIFNYKISNVDENYETSFITYLNVKPFVYVIDKIIYDLTYDYENFNLDLLANPKVQFKDGFFINNSNNQQIKIKLTPLNIDCFSNIFNAMYPYCETDEGLICASKLDSVKLPYCHKYSDNKCVIFGLTGHWYDIDDFFIELSFDILDKIKKYFTNQSEELPTGFTCKSNQYLCYNDEIKCYYGKSDKLDNFIKCINSLIDYKSVDSYCSA